MPNWCHNVVRVSGPRQEIIRFMKKGKIEKDSSVLWENNKHGRLLSKFVRQPKSEMEKARQVVVFHHKPEWSVMAESIKQTYKLSWGQYNNVGSAWAYSFWGTKWDVDDYRITTRNQYSVELDFDTAWSPPNQWLKTVAGQFTALSFSVGFIEAGCNFIGETLYTNGKEVSDKCVKLSGKSKTKKQVLAKYRNFSGNYGG